MTRTGDSSRSALRARAWIAPWSDPQTARPATGRRLLLPESNVTDASEPPGPIALAAACRTLYDAHSSPGRRSKSHNSRRQDVLICRARGARKWPVGPSSELAGGSQVIAPWRVRSRPHDCAREALLPGCRTRALSDSCRHGSSRSAVLHRDPATADALPCSRQRQPGLQPAGLVCSTRPSESRRPSAQRASTRPSPYCWWKSAA